MLDNPNIFRHVVNLCPFVADSIWIGKLNNIRNRVSSANEHDREAIQRIEKEQTDDRIHAIYDALKNRPLIRWKKSIKKVVGIAASQEPGLDK
jgi:hypothetical protein